jgi:hypothetical protein
VRVKAVEPTRNAWRTAAWMLIATVMLDLLSLLRMLDTYESARLGLTKAAISGVLALGLFGHARWARTCVFLSVAAGVILSAIGFARMENYADIPLAVVFLVCPALMLIGQPSRTRTIVTSVIFGIGWVIMLALYALTLLGG